MLSLTHLLDDPVYDRLEQSARRLIDEAGRLLKRLEGARPDSSPSVRTPEPGAPAGGGVSGADFSPYKTGLERDRIEATGAALQRVSESIRECERRLSVLPLGTAPLDLTWQAAVLVVTACLLASLVSRLRSMTALERAQGLLRQIQGLEAKSDACAAESLRALYAAPVEPGRLVALKDLIDLLDRAVEECGTAAQLVWQIFLENN